MCSEHNTQKTPATTEYSSGVDPGDHVADWEPWLAATAQHHETVSQRLLSAGKRSKFKIQSGVSTECILLLHHQKVEKLLSWTIVNRGVSVFSFLPKGGNRDGY